MTHPQVKAIPEWMHSLTPYLICDGASEAIAFYKAAFGAVERDRMPDKSGRIMNATLMIGNSAIMIMDEYPEMKALGPKAPKRSPVTIHLQVEDMDAVVAKAVAAGATVTMPAADMFWGDRYAMLVDPFGHSWSVATHVRDVSPAELTKGMDAMETTA